MLHDDYLEGHPKNFKPQKVEVIAYLIFYVMLSFQIMVISTQAETKNNFPHNLYRRGKISSEHYRIKHLSIQK